MIATADIFDALAWLLKLLTDTAHALHMTPFTLLIIIIFVVTGWHHWAERYTARRDMEAAMRKAQEPKNPEPPTLP